MEKSVYALLFTLALTVSVKAGDIPGNVIPPPPPPPLSTTTMTTTSSSGLPLLTELILSLIVKS